ncbi:MAG: hypothetical protein M9921_11850 [Fimbriimonadaceae bacterium]|nr:hypothetical protein [Chthonomonadaceae bacterium]MCO5297540.1 hypothetical protein [Fimbriimonadaceae bacterium]
MKRPTKSEIKSAIAKLNAKEAFSTGAVESKKASFTASRNTERKTKNGY